MLTRTVGTDARADQRHMCFFFGLTLNYWGRGYMRRSVLNGLKTLQILLSWEHIYNITFKEEYKTEPFVELVHNRQHRSAIAQFRCGVLPLKVETGRYMNIPPEFRLCTFCVNNTPETEIHFLLYCNKYDALRQRKFNSTHLYIKYPDFNNNTDSEKLTILMTSHLVLKHTAAFIWRCFDLRRKSAFIFC